MKGRLMSAPAAVFSLAALAWIPQAAHASDACATVLCMAGMLQGKGIVTGCDGPVSDYFDIVSYHHGHVDFSETPKDRLNFLNSCPTNSGWAGKINSQYGSDIR